METCHKTSAKADGKNTSRRLNIFIYLAIIPIRFYQYFISPLLGPKCRFEPTCSCYAEQSIRRFGLLKGGLMASKRLSKCHPWHPGGFDPVPEKKPNSSTNS